MSVVLALCANCDHDVSDHAEDGTRIGGLYAWPCTYPVCLCSDYEEARP